MTQTSLNAFVISVDIRQKKTLLVEGDTDKKIIQRLAASNHNCKTGTFVVDTADSIKSPIELGPVGNKTKVTLAYERLERNLKFAALIDREWDGLRDSTGSWQEFTPPTATGRKFVTWGHSIENYSFDPTAFSKAILSCCFEYFHEDHIPELERCFSKSLLMGLAFSKVAADRELIGRLYNLLRPSDFNWSKDENLSLSPSVQTIATLSSKNVRDAEVLFQDITNEYQTLLTETINIPVKFYLHGHLGEEVLNAVIAAKVASMGAPDHVVAAFFNEPRDVRRSRLRDYFASLLPLPTSIESAVGFLSS